MGISPSRANSSLLRIYPIYEYNGIFYEKYESKYILVVKIRGYKSISYDSRISFCVAEKELASKIRELEIYFVPKSGDIKKKRNIEVSTDIDYTKESFKLETIYNSAEDKFMSKISNFEFMNFFNVSDNKLGIIIDPIYRVKPEDFANISVADFSYKIIFRTLNNEQTIFDSQKNKKSTFFECSTIIDKNNIFDCEVEIIPCDDVRMFGTCVMSPTFIYEKFPLIPILRVTCIELYFGYEMIRADIHSDQAKWM